MKLASYIPRRRRHCTIPKTKVKGSVYEKFLKLSDRERSDLGKVRKLFIDTP